MRHLRPTLKFLHELSSAGIIGALLAHLVLLTVATTTAMEYATLRRGIELLTRWVLLPSLAVVLISGLLAIAAHRPFHSAGWPWIKALTGIALFEGTLGAIVGTSRDAAALAAKVAAGEGDPAGFAPLLRHEWGGLWTILALSVANIVIAVWRPRFKKTAPGQ